MKIIESACYVLRIDSFPPGRLSIDITDEAWAGHTIRLLKGISSGYNI
ncbi:MAG TPA: hypothetical protein PLW73_04245 [Methanoregulaceae archaeon]|jgi:hypothetical protein|nr:hypothetical protein [Methanoregulaceae archaeon]